MQSFQTIQPSALLAPYVKLYWFLTANSSGQASERVIPSGQICLMFHRGERLFSSAHNRLQPRAFLGGLETGYTDLLYSGSIDLVCTVFQPAGAKAFFNMPLIELSEQSVAVDDLEDPQLIELGNRLFDIADIQTSVLLIEQFLFSRLRTPAVHNLLRINAALQSVYSGQQNVEALAQTACLSYKQFKRVFAEYTGANPKDWLRTVRFQKALYTLQTQPAVSLAQLACECGYYDQPHLIKEFKIFSGYTPVEYLSIYAPYSDYFS
ncbi:MAG: helix-turn-helix domain-containing protein [Prevotellaceae bacterium]|jgi:AraC-like DNA-binding protein|nr:helix-turn-helix domain-containing protein [Prevotellaceae bacterium]